LQIAVGIVRSFALFRFRIVLQICSDVAFVSVVDEPIRIAFQLSASHSQLKETTHGCGDHKFRNMSSIIP